MIGILIAAGADVHERVDDYSGMCAAARAGNAFAVHALSDAGAPVVESDGDAPVFYAVRNGKTEATEALLARGTCIGVRTRVTRRTPLHMAALWGSAPAVRVLLDHGADVTSVDEAGKTPDCLVDPDRAYSNDDLLAEPEPFGAFEYDRRQWEGKQEHAACIKLMLANEPRHRRDIIWARRRALVMLIAWHRKCAAAAAAAAATPRSEHGGCKRLAYYDGGGAPALPVGGGACAPERGPGEGGAIAEGAMVGGGDALRSVVARLADLGEQHLLRQIVLFLYKVRVFVCLNGRPLGCIIVRGILFFLCT